MNQSTLIKIVLAISMFLVAGYLLWPNEAQVDSNNASVVSFTPEVVTKAELIEAPKVIIEKKPKVSLLSASKSAFLISKVYAEELSFPVYSQPLKPTDFDRLNPNFFNPQSMPIDDEGGTINASLSKYRYSYPEPIVATLEGEGIKSASFTLIDSETKEVLLSEHFQWHENTWQLNLVGKKEFPDAIHAKIVANVDAKSIPIVLALKYIYPIAIIESFDPAKTEGSDMVIDANITTKKSGLYRIRANLFDADNQPIAHLVNKKKLKVGHQSMSLKAHQSVLQGRKSPFYLSTFMIELMSPSPGVRKKFGESRIKKYEIKDFALSGLGAEDYQISPQEKQRLELLQAMANTEQ
tara:strand:+ start:271 stop:1326 length:1056 start_codon:yes stop_codon:yes gene_type:complete